MEGKRVGGGRRGRAKREAERKAVVGGKGEELSYGELERRSNRMRRRLREEGVKRGGVVGIRVEGMCEWVIAAVGVLKAGGAFVPLEGGEGERKRRAEEVREAGVECVVTGERTEERREEELRGMGVKVVKLDGEGEEEEGAEEEKTIFL